MPMTTPTTLRSARATGLITQVEYKQYRDFYLGLEMLNGQTDNMITRRLWTNCHWAKITVQN